MVGVVTNTRICQPSGYVQTYNDVGILFFVTALDSNADSS